MKRTLAIGISLCTAFAGGYLFHANLIAAPDKNMETVAGTLSNSSLQLVQATEQDSQNSLTNSPNQALVLQSNQALEDSEEQFGQDAALNSEQIAKFHLLTGDSWKEMTFGEYAEFYSLVDGLSTEQLISLIESYLVQDNEENQFAVLVIFSKFV